MNTIKKINKGLANEVYLLNLNQNKYILKKYNYKYDFNLSNKLYDILESNGIKVLKPIDSLKIDKDKYSIFNYVKDKQKNVNLIPFFEKYLKIDRKCDFQNNFKSKMNKYIRQLEKSKDLEEIEVLKIYKKLNLKPFYEEKYFNHGDLSRSNLIINNNEIYVIDFDETIVTSQLYDYAVICIKNYFKKIEEFENIISQNLNIDKNQLRNAVKVYLCKILIEKFYYRKTKKLNLESKLQKKDYYKKYLMLLERLDKND